MVHKRYIVDLTAEERERLLAFIFKGKASARALLKARILLKADAGAQGESWADSRIAEALETNTTMIERVRAKFVTEGLEAVLARKKRQTPPVEPIFDGEAQAQLIALACSEPPEGYAHWSIRLLAEKVVERKIVEKASGARLKKRSQAASEKILGYSAQSQRRLRCQDGRYLGGLHPSP